MLTDIGTRNVEVPIAVGIDQSLTCSALFKAYLQGNDIVYKLSIMKPTCKGVDRLEEIAKWLERHLSPAPTYFGIEDYSLGSYGEKDGAEIAPGVHRKVSVNVLPMLGELGGICRLIGKRSGAELVIPTPTQVKKFATGKGNASKDDVMAAARAYVPDYDFRTDDESDALFICNIALAMAQGLPGESTPQAQVLHALRNPQIAIDAKKAKRDRERGNIFGAAGARTIREREEGVKRGNPQKLRDDEPTGF